MVSSPARVTKQNLLEVCAEPSLIGARKKWDEWDTCMESRPAQVKIRAPQLLMREYQSSVKVRVNSKMKGHLARSCRSR